MGDWTKTHMLKKQYIGRLYIFIKNFKNRPYRSLFYERNNPLWINPKYSIYHYAFPSRKL